MAWNNILKKVGKPEESIFETEIISIPENSVPEKEHAETDLRSLLEEKNITILSSSKQPQIKELANLVLLMAENHKVAKELYREIRGCNSYPGKRLVFSVSEYGEEEKNGIYKVVQLLERYGIIVEHSYNKEKKSIVCEVSTVPKVINFLNGNYLEICAAIMTEEVLRTYCADKGYEFEIMTNVVIQSRDSSHNELDILFRVSDVKNNNHHFFWAEIKSGNNFNNYSRYYELGKKIGAIPDHLILLNAEEDCEEIENVIKYFYEYYVTDIPLYKKNLLRMLNNCFNGGSENE